MKRRGPRIIVFDDPWSFLHFILGIATKFLSRIGLAWLSLAIFVAFVAWEVIEQENRFCKLGDFIEFVLGWICGSILLDGWW